MKKDIRPRLWDVKAGKASGRSCEAAEINAIIDGAKSAIYKVYRQLQDRSDSVTAEKVKNTFPGIDTGRRNLPEAFDEHNMEKKRLIGVSISLSMYDKYRITRDHLGQFLREWYNVSDISLKEIDISL